MELPWWSGNLPTLFNIIVLKITDKQRLWLSGDAENVWKDSTPSMAVHTPSTMRCSISQNPWSLSHLDETSTVGTAAFENASNSHAAK